MLSHPLIDHCFASDGGAGVPNVAQMRFVEADKRDNGTALVREPDDDADGGVLVIGVCQAPQRVTPCLLQSLEGRGLLGWRFG